MNKYYRIIDRNLRRIIDMGKIPVIYPMGMAGIYAKSILNSRYGIEGVYVDNEQCRYSDHIIAFEDLMSRELTGHSVIVCTIDKGLEKLFLDQCAKAGIEAISIRNPHIYATHDKSSYFKKLIENCAPMKANFPTVRIGSCSDGGYNMLDDFGAVDVCLSFGIGGEISWEQEMLKRGIDRIYCYDPMINNLPISDNRLIFYKQGIAGYDSPQGIYKSMATIIKDIDVLSNSLVLKMDVEGAEWEFMRETSPEVLNLFKQMTFELHGLTDIGREKEILDCLSKLRETHIPVWVHGNNAGIAEISGDYVVPEMLEITYARKKDYHFSKTSYDCPASIDFPNVSHFDDICLKNWGSCCFE